MARSNLPIIDGEFEDIPTYDREPKTTKKVVSVFPHVKKDKGTRSQLINHSKLGKVESREAKTKEGRIDHLATNLISEALNVSPQHRIVVQAGVRMLVGRQKVKGPEFEFLKALFS